MAETMSITGAQASHAQADLLDPNTSGVYDDDFEPDTQSTTMSVGTAASSRGYMSLSRLSKHQIKIKSFSSFPNLLSLYQSPIQEEAHVDVEKKERKKKVKPVKTKDDIKKLDWEEYHEKRNRQEQRMIRVNAVAREQLEKFDDYVNTMKQKVEKQREERKKYNETLQERLRQQEEVEKKKLRLHRGPKHHFVHDKSYLKDLPVSNLCKQTRLADQLQRKGVLRSNADVEKFWRGYTNKNRKGLDIFAADNKHSVNYPNQWMGPRMPEIRIECDDDSITDATEIQPSPVRQLPPIQKRKKKRKMTSE